MDCDDAALLERFIAIPHRSRFYTGQVPDEPYSFPADSDIKKNFQAWRPYALKWALQGLKMYQMHRFRNIPPSCREFKDALMMEKDTVREFLEDAVYKGDAHDFVKIKELYNDYCSAFRALQRDKKTFKNAGSFQSGVERVLRDGVFVKKHQYRNSAGQKTTANSVITGYKRALTVQS